MFTVGWMASGREAAASGGGKDGCSPAGLCSRPSIIGPGLNDRPALSICEVLVGVRLLPLVLGVGGKAPKDACEPKF